MEENETIVTEQDKPYWHILGCHQSPFSTSAQCVFYYPFTQFENHLEVLGEFSQEGKPLLIITGLKGSGKSALLSQFHKKMAGQLDIVALEGQSELTIERILEYFANQVGSHFTPEEKNVTAQYRDLMDALAHSDTKHLLVIDDADNLSNFTLSALLQLADAQSHSRVYLSLVLLGQPSLQQKLEQLVIDQQLALTFSTCLIKPLTEEETKIYLKSRLQESGLVGDFPFSDEDIREIYQTASGNLSVINQIAQQKLKLLALAADVKKTTLEAKTKQRSKAHYFSTHRIRFISLVLVIVALIIYWQLQHLSHKPTTAKAQSVAVSVPIATLQASKEPLGPQTQVEKVKPMKQKQPISQRAKPIKPKPVALTKKPIKKGFTLQILGTRHLAELKKFIAKNHLKKQVWYFKTAYKKSPWYVLAYGHYKTRQQARKSIVNLPKSLQRRHPWIRPLS